MKNLKIKSLLFSLLSFFTITIFITSCQQDDIFSEDNIVENTTEFELRSCIPQAPNVNVVVNHLNGIIGEVQKRNASNPSNIPGFYDSYADYLENILCLTTDVNWNSTPCPYNGQNSASCPGYTTGALQRLRCDLEAFNSNPSCGNARSLQIRFVDYIKTLNICFNTNLSESGYADALRLPPCTGYYY